MNYLILLTVPLKPQLQSTSLRITSIQQDTSHPVSQPFPFTGKFHCKISLLPQLQVRNYYKLLQFYKIFIGSGFPFLADIRLSIKTDLLQHLRSSPSSMSCARNRHLSVNLPSSPCMFIHSKNTVKILSWPSIHPISPPSLQSVFTLPSAPQLLHLLCLFLQHFGRHCSSLSQSPVQLQSGQHGLCNT